MVRLAKLGRAIETPERTGHGEVRRSPHVLEHFEVGIQFGQRTDQRFDSRQGQLAHDVRTHPFAPDGGLIARRPKVPGPLRFRDGGLRVGRQAGHECSSVLYPARCTETRAGECDAGNPGRAAW